MLLEFIVPYFGASELLLNALSTVLKQKDKKDIGVIIVDDNGTKHSEESAKVVQFIEMMKGMVDIPITYIKNDENIGSGLSRNRGLSSATAKYVSFLDSDDYLNENFVTIFKEECEKGEDFNIFCGSCIAVKSDTEYLAISPEIITWLHGKAYLLSFLKENEITFPALRFNEDSGFNSIAYDITKEIRYYKGDIPMYYWMQSNPNSLTNLSNKKPYAYSIITYLESITFAYDHLLKKVDSEQLDRFPAQILQVYLFYCELLYRDEKVDEVEKYLQTFFDTIHPSKWYQSQRVKDKIAQYVIYQNILGPVIPEITFAQFIKKFEKEPLNFR